MTVVLVVGHNRLALRRGESPGVQRYIRDEIESNPRNMYLVGCPRRSAAVFFLELIFPSGKVFRTFLSSVRIEHPLLVIPQWLSFFLSLCTKMFLLSRFPC